MELFEITTQQERSRSLPLFYGIQDTMLQTFLEGVDGQGWCDDLSFPRLAVIAIKDFLFFGGNHDAQGAAEFAAFLPPTGSDSYIVTPCEEEWVPLIEAAHPGKTTASTRFAMKRTLKGFDKEKLRRFTQALPDGYVLLGMDEEIYEMAKGEEWSRDFVSSFADADDFMQRGIGFCVLKDEELVAGASSFSVYSEGIEVQVQAKEGHQRKGLARACSAALLLHCLSHKRYAGWDAANAASCNLAQQLGYQVDRAYTALEITR